MLLRHKAYGKLSKLGNLCPKVKLVQGVGKTAPRPALVMSSKPLSNAIHPNIC